MGNFYTDTIETSPLFASVNAVKTLDLLFPPFRARVEAILSDAAASGHQMQVFETYRSRERQLQLFNQHLTELKTVGVHAYGLACDIAFLEPNGSLSWKGDFSILAALAHKHNLISGADWGKPQLPHSFRDLDHVQMISVGDQTKLFNGSWYPLADYNPYSNL